MMILLINVTNFFIKLKNNPEKSLYMDWFHLQNIKNKETVAAFPQKISIIDENYAYMTTIETKCQTI